MQKKWKNHCPGEGFPRAYPHLDAGFSLLHYGFKCRGIVDGHLGQLLSIQFDVGLSETKHKPAVGHTFKPTSGVDSGNPQLPELAFSLLPVSVRILAGSGDVLFGRAQQFAPSTTEAFGFFQNSLVSLVPSYGISCSGHCSLSSHPFL